MGPRIAVMLCVGSLALGGCSESTKQTRAPEQPHGSAPVWPEIPTEGFVVLPRGAPVYLQPSFASPSAQLGWPTAVGPPWPAGGIVAEVLGDRDGFVEIAPLHQPYGMHCEEVLDGESYEVTLYVSPWSLSPVTTRTIEQEYEDGTSITLAPGVPVRPRPDDPKQRWAVAVDGVRLHLELPDDAVGLAYSARAEEIRRGQPWNPSQGDPRFTYDEGSPLLVPANIGREELQLDPLGPWGNGHRVMLVGPCIQAVVLTDHLPTVGTPDFVHFDFGLGAPELRRVPPGAAALDMTALVGLEPPPPDPIVEEERTFHIIDDDIEGELLLPEPQQLGLIGVIGLGSGGSMVFERGASVYLGAGAAAGTLLRVQTLHDGWVLGDRMCFSTMFGAQFRPMLPVCFDGREVRVQASEDFQHDHGSTTVIPGEVEAQGAFESGAVEAALRRHRIDLRRCFDQARMQVSSLPRRIELELALELDGQGSVTAVRRRTGVLGPTVDCVIEAAKAWTMPATTDGAPARVVFAVALTTEG